MLYYSHFMKTSVLSITISLALLLLFITSCKKPNDQPSSTSVNLNFYHLVGNNALVYNQEYTVNGRKLKFTKVQFYVSDIQFKKDDNSYTYPEMRYALVHGVETAYTINKLDTGYYKKIEFAVGVDSAANHADPAQWGATHPLYINSNYASYWDWTQGYVFMKLEGYVDSTAAGNGNPTTGFAYHIGNDDMLRNISLTINKEVQGNDASIELNVDYAKLLENVDFRTELQTHSTGSQALAQKIADKTAEAITIK